MSSAVRQLIFIAAFLTAVIIVLRDPVAAAFYQYGAFSSDASARTASALAFFAIGLAGHIVVHVLTRAFYAMQDTRTPVGWAIVAVAINVPLMVLLVEPMGIEGLALALSVASIIEVIGLLRSLQRRIESIEAAAIAAALARAAAGAGAAAVVMFGGLALLETSAPPMLGDPLGRVGALVILLVAGALAYWAVGALLGSPELRQLRGATARLRRRSA